MRITGGSWASRRLPATPRGELVRPTPDALREQAFAVLGPYLDGASFLDLFAGTGVNTLEALSRGAADAVLIEHARGSGELIRRNLLAFGVAAPRARLIAEPWQRAIPRLAAGPGRFAVAWCDPPFADWQQGVQALQAARMSGLLAPAARIVLETPPRQSGSIEGFEVARPLRGAVLLIASAP